MSPSILFIPKSMEEALAVRSEHGRDCIVMSGGTLVMQAAAEGGLIGRQVMSLQRLGLDGIEMSNGSMRLGAMTKVKDLTSLDGVPPLAQSAALLGGPALKNMATLGGNLFARPPWGDLTVALLALDATVELTGVGGRRTQSLDGFLEAGGPGDDLVTAITVGRPAGPSAYLKQRRRKANSPAIVAVAVALEVGNDGRCLKARIASSGGQRIVARSKAGEGRLQSSLLTEEDLKAAAMAAMEESSPFTDALATDWYRRKMIGVFVRRALESALEQSRRTA